MVEDTPYPEKCAAILERMEEVPEEERGADFCNLVKKYTKM